MSGLANPKEEKENTGGAAASNDDGPKERKGGLGRDKASRKFENATAEERAAANSDGKFGYYDMTNKRYVPAFFDMFDGGGQDTRGDKFKGGPLSNLLNKIGVDPYGSQRERLFVAPNTSSAIQAAVQSGGAPQRSVPTVTESVRPRLRQPLTGEDLLMTQPVVGVDPRNFAQGTEPMTMPIGAGNAMVNPYAVGGGLVQTARGSTYDEVVPQTISPQYQPDMAMGQGSAAIDDGGEGAIGFMPTIYPSQAAKVDAQNQVNREAMRNRMASLTEAEYNAMSRAEQAEAGLPVGGLNLAFAGSDAFKQPMQYSGRGTSSGDPEFDEFMRLAANDSSLAGMIDNPIAMRNVFNMYKDIRAGNR